MSEVIEKVVTDNEVLDCIEQYNNSVKRLIERLALLGLAIEKAEQLNADQTVKAAAPSLPIKKRSLFSMAHLQFPEIDSENFDEELIDWSNLLASLHWRLAPKKQTEPA
ncbi:hypothetical protein [Flexibacterium corallicola]|uniref:hypothetical protein n=1 Tax=Flexibacterium corallicola TaxID=3037259 RepID=UPI00286F086A|nr:hypothetical protein [Pseudovibrio sp. M1P-2-3]